MVERIARAWLWVALALIVTIAGATAAATAPRAFRWAKAEIHEIDVIRAELRAFVQDAKDSLDDNYYDIKATVATFATLARDSETFVLDLRAGISGGPDSHGAVRVGILPALEGLISQFRETAGALRQDLDSLTKGVNQVTGAAAETLAPLKATLEHLSTLTEQLDRDAAAASPKFFKTADQINEALARLDKLLADPNIARTLANVEGATESVDDALRPWRTRAGLLKTILSKLIGLVKVTIPIP